MLDFGMCSRTRWQIRCQCLSPIREKLNIISGVDPRQQDV